MRRHVLLLIGLTSLVAVAVCGFLLTRGEFTAKAALPAARLAEFVAGFGLGEYRSDLYSTAREAGVPGYEAIEWNGVMVPAGTPPAAGNGPHADAFTRIAEQRAAWIRQHGG